MKLPAVVSPPYIYHAHIYKCLKQFCTSTFERACAAEKTNTIHIGEMLESFSSDTKRLHSTNQDLHTYIDSVEKKSEA